MPENAKPLFDAINDAVSALTEVVRSLRATARKNAVGTSRAVGARKVSVKTRVKRARNEIKSGARKVKKDVKNTAKRTWQTLHTDGPAPE